MTVTDGGPRAGGFTGGRAMKRVRMMAGMLVLAGTVLAAGDEKQPTDLSAFMRPKLKYSQQLLEGLALENYDTITTNAKALNQLTHAEQWQVLPGVDYVRQS